MPESLEKFALISLVSSEARSISLGKLACYIAQNTLSIMSPIQVWEDFFD
jgi:hypothetical protein